MKVNHAFKCRAYDIQELTQEQMLRHCDLMVEFAKRHVFSPCGGMSGQGRVVHFLNESVCDEYEQRMAITKRKRKGDETRCSPSDI